MPQAIEIRQDTLMLISNKAEYPLADLQAMHDDWEKFEIRSDNPLILVIDWTSPDGTYHTWLDMPKTVFDETFRFAFEPHNPNKFETVVTV